jgi:hypothetical protein
MPPGEVEVLCALCGKPMQRPLPSNPYLEVTGWRKRRAQGGTNALRAEKQTGAMAHDGCVNLAVSGYRFYQERLPL